MRDQNLHPDFPASTDEYAELSWQYMQKPQATPRQLWTNMLFYTKAISEQSVQLPNPISSPIESALNQEAEHQDFLMRGALPVFSDVADIRENSRSIYTWSDNPKEMISGKGVFNIRMIPHNRGNATSLINDFHNISESPNVDWTPYYYDGFSYSVVYTITNIKKGAQLLVDYGEGYWESRKDENLEYLSVLDDFCFKRPSSPQYLLTCALNNGS